jgi:hypothetical protein
MWVDPDTSGKSASDLIFLGLDPTAGKACGWIKVVLKGTLQATLFLAASRLLVYQPTSIQIPHAKLLKP